MKSLYILCEYGISYITIRNLDKKGITFSDILFNPDYFYEIWGRGYGSKITKVITEAANRAKDDPKTNSVFDLGIYGVSRHAMKKMFQEGITLKELFFLDVNELQLFTESHVNDAIKLKHALQDFYHDPEYIHISNAIYIMYLIEEAKLNDFTEAELFEIVREKNAEYSSSFVSKALEELVKGKKLSLNGDRYSMYVPTLEDAINSIQKENYKQIIIKKFTGKSITSIAKELGVRRQNIWNVLTRAMQQFPHVYEDRYQEIFEKYDFNAKVFCKVHNVDEKVYYYLMERYKKGEESLFDLLDDDNISEDIKEKVSNNLKFVRYNDTSIRAIRKKLLKKILKEQKTSLLIVDLIEIYNHKIIENGYDMLAPLPLNSKRNIEEMLSRDDKCILSAYRSFRYFDFESLSDADVEELQSLLSVSEGVYSSDFMFRNNTELMKRLNIYNYYELHNILRRINTSNDVIFSRMPNILIGCNDKEAFFQKIIDLYSPINYEDFVEMVYSKYGYKKDSVRLFLANHFQHCIGGDVIYSKLTVFDVPLIERLKKVLIEDQYSLGNFFDIVADALNIQAEQMDFEYANIRNNLHKLGYKRRGERVFRRNVNYLRISYRDEVQGDYYKFNPNYRKTNRGYYYFLHRMSKNLELLKVDGETYITSSGLNKKNLSKDKLFSLRERIASLFTENQYFNLYMVKQKVNLDIVYDCGLNDKFIESLIHSVPRIKILTVLGNTLFIKTDEEESKQKFIGHIIEKFGAIEVSEIDKYIVDTFHIFLDERDIALNINKKKYYYKEDIAKVYVNEEYYLSDVGNNVDSD